MGGEGGCQKVTMMMGLGGQKYPKKGDVFNLKPLRIVAKVLFSF